MAHARLYLSGFTVGHCTLKGAGQKSSYFIRDDEKLSWQPPRRDRKGGGRWLQGGASPASHYSAMTQRDYASSLPHVAWGSVQGCGAPWRGYPTPFPNSFALNLSPLSVRMLYYYPSLCLYKQSWTIFLVCQMGHGYKLYHPQNLDGKNFTFLYFSKTSYIWLQSPDSSGMTRNSISVINVPPFSSGLC